MKSLISWLMVSTAIHVLIFLSFSNLVHFHQEKLPLMFDLTIVPAVVDPVDIPVTQPKSKHTPEHKKESFKKLPSEDAQAAIADTIKPDTGDTLKRVPTFEPEAAIEAVSTTPSSKSNISSGAIQELNEEFKIDKQAKVLYSIRPQYPRLAKNAGIEGTVIVTMLIEINGRVKEIRFDKIPNDLFRKPVEEAVSRWRFKPAIFQGKPVKCKVTQGFEFYLDNFQ